MKEQLDYTLWVTSGVRFSQSLRYEKIESTIYFTLLMISVYLTIFSLLAPNLFAEEESSINLFIISSSILITILVVLLKSANFTSRSNLQHECGRKIRKLLYDLKSAKTEDEIVDINNEYNSILDDFENHKKVDLSYFWYENYDKADESRKKNAPNKFQRNFIAPLVFTIFPLTTKSLAFTVPPLIIFLMTV